MSQMTLNKDEFLSHVQNHEMFIEQEDGICRSILFMKPKSVDRYFRINTWSGHLCISGDMGTYVFKRVHDMFNFFRQEKINLAYWSEKCEAGEYEKYSPEAARSALNQEFENWKECTDFSEEKIQEERDSLDSIDTDDYFELVEAVRHWKPENELGVPLMDFWEHNLNEYTYHYIWCCYAIVWAISQYDEFKLIEGGAA